MLLKKFFCLLLLAAASINITMAQKNINYTAQWKKVADLEKKGLTASALKEVLVIYNQALKDNNDAQQIKSCMYQVKYRNMTEENSQEKNIFFVDTLIAKAKAPSKQILQSMQAEMFWRYLQNNRWKFYDRTKLAEEKSRDISTWSLDKLHGTITGLYLASIDASAAPLLKTTKLDGFDPILIKGENTRNLRPTLYDFLTFRALDYLMTDERDLTQPAYRFTIDDAAAFAPASEFIEQRFTTKDSASLHYHALQLLQDILSFHIKDQKKDALLDADLARLNFVYRYAVNEHKEKLYEAALKNLEEQYPSNEAAAQAVYLRAKIYFDKGQDFDPYSKTTNQYEIKRAKELLETAVKKYPRSEGGINAQHLLNSILQPSLSLETEKVNVPQQPFRTLVKYKNVKTVYFRVVKTSRDFIQHMDRRDYDKVWQEYISLKPLKSWSVGLPDPLDYQEHAAEVKIDALNNGIYFILASIDENFSLQKNIIAKQITYVSNISYIHNNNNEYYALHRYSGQPLAGTNIQVWESKYNAAKGQYDWLKTERHTADKNGLFKIKQTKEYRNIQLQLSSGNDELFMLEQQYSYGYNSYQQPAETVQAFLFTDRSIYRPGQTVYFKGIVINKTNKAAASKVMPSFNSTIQLKDANGQKINEVKLVTNEYGSYHGTFKLPEGSLNGQFSLQDSAGNGYFSFSVEEYKRPKFAVEIKKPAGTYRVNDSIQVTGTAKAYAGNNIDGATVKYRVLRKVRYPIWWQYGGFIRKGRSMPYGRNEEVEITNGTAATNSRGEFIISFKALPDESIAQKDQPTFYYEVSADVTDLNGETRSGETSVAVAYQSLQLHIDLADKMNADSLYDLKVRSTNMNDVFEKAQVTIHIHQLQVPGKVFRERYWELPDQFVMSRDEYYSLFPHDVYKDEDKVINWKIQQEITQVKDSTKEKEAISLRLQKGTPGEKLLPGWYKIIVTAKDKYGEEVKAEKYVLLTTDNQRPAENTAPVTVNVTKATAEPGEKISYDIKTGFDDVWMIHTLSKADSAITSNYPTVQNNKPYKNEIAVTENDRGGMAMNYAFVKHNRVYSGNENFEVPWSNKELHISYQTFRDKLLPGANEKWTVKISGNKGEQVAAEMLAGMYDASLDQFKPHGWNAINIWPTMFKNVNWTEDGFTNISSEDYRRISEAYMATLQKRYDKLLYFMGNGSFDEIVVVGYGGRKNKRNSELAAAAPLSQALESETAGIAVTAVYDSIGNEMGEKNIEKEEDQDKTNDAESPKQIQIRKNFNETAFFFPALNTDAAGNVSFSVTLPEALTQWKLMTLAHTKDLKSGYVEKTLVTQKPLMVQPNAPRFMREGDKMEFSAKVVNLGDSTVNGTAVLELLDAATNQPVDGLFKNISATQNFTTAAGQSTVVKYAIEIPTNFNSALTYRIVAKAADFSDGEEMSLPVLTNRALVTESMPLNLRNTSRKDYKFAKLLNSGNSKTISNHALTVEYTSNPAWYAVQALPYLMEYPYECAEQTFNRYYANTLASFVSNSIPKLKAVFAKWKTIDTAALVSNLQKNEELKSALLQETPWVMDAQNEAQQKRNIALLFDMVKMSSEANKSISQLKEMQLSNGGFVWFKGGPDDRYITQYIITGIGHLKNLDALPANEGQQQQDIMAIAKKAIPYLDKKIKEDYDWLVKNKVKLTQNNLSYTAIQYLYMRSFFTETPVAAASQTAFNYYKQQAQKYWLSNGKYMQAMIALALHRTGDTKTPKAITRSLKENSINHEELGMYWKDWTNRGWFWHQAPIESQALMIEAFTEIEKNQHTINDLKTWLLKQKQTQNWGTTKATAEACYALLLNGSNWLAEEKEVTINLGSTSIKSDNEESGTGYFKERIEGSDVKPVMGNISVTIQPSNPSTLKKPGQQSTSWGSVYWQYFEDLDKITSAATPLQLVKKLFVERNTGKGPVLDAVADGTSLKVGDKLKVRIELRVDRDMEYVHMKDMRAACMEPVNVISSYKYQGGLGYYESTKDASTNFFFSWLNKGTYVFEYPLFVTHAGNFSNGITTIQCMYAPEFTSHSEGIRVNVQK
jgi:uncharacterized protein YfaS (alpha-2-macroglobulin family)